MTEPHPEERLSEARTTRRFDLLFQMDTLFHQRVNFTLLAESIFIVAATTVWQHAPAVVLLSVLGIVFVVLLTIPTIKLYWRVALMIQTCRCDEDYRRFVDATDVNNKAFGRLSRWLYQYFVNTPPPKEGWRPCWRHTGWLFSWGILILCTLAWVAILIVRFAFPPCAS